MHMGRVAGASPAAGLARSLSLQRANARAKSCTVIRAGVDYQSCRGGRGGSPHDRKELSRRIDVLFTASMSSSASATDQCMIGSCIGSCIGACIDNDDDDEDDSGIRAGIDQYLPSKEAHLQQAQQLVNDGGSSNICSVNGAISERCPRPFMVVNDDDDGSRLNATKRSLSADISTSAADYKACFSSLSERIDRASDLWDREFSSMSSCYYYAGDQDAGILSGLQRRLNNGSFFSDAAASKDREDDACSTSSLWSELEESVGADAGVVLAEQIVEEEEAAAALSPNAFRRRNTGHLGAIAGTHEGTQLQEEGAANSVLDIETNISQGKYVKEEGRIVDTNIGRNRSRGFSILQGDLANNMGAGSTASNIYGSCRTVHMHDTASRGDHGHHNNIARRICSSELEEIRAADALDQLPANSVAVEKVSVNPAEDFRESMYEMMMEKDMEEECVDMEDLLHCYLLLNPSELHDVIREVFSHVWIDVIMAIR